MDKLSPLLLCFISGLSIAEREGRMAVICQVITRHQHLCVHQGVIELSFYRGEEGTTKNVIAILHKLQVRFIRGVFANLGKSAV